jgi:PAS domain S-box-containing protein
MLQRSAEAVVRHLDAALARIWTLNERQSALELQASAGLYTHLNGEHSRIAVGKFEIGLIAQERKPHLTNDAPNDDRISHPEWAKETGMIAFAGYPLLVEGRLVGVLGMFARTPLGQDTVEALEAVADTVAQNIQRKRAEEALRESEARFRIFFERSADPMTLLDPQTFQYVEVNEAAAHLIGASDREALRAYSPVERWPERQPDGRLSVEKAREMVQLSLTQGSHRFEWLTRRYDGGELPLDIVMTAVPFGERTLISLVYRDIRARKRAESEIRQLNMSLEQRVAERTIELARSEEKFRALFQGTNQAIVLHDGTGAIVDANPSWLRLLGYSSLEDALGKRLPERSAPIQPSGERAEVFVKKHIANALATGSTQHEWIVLRHDGTELPVEVLLTRIDLGDRRLLQAVFNDITARKRAEAELRESEMRLRESEERFRTAFRLSPLNITILRLSDAKFVEANDAFVRWLGVDREKIIGHDSRELNIWLNLEDREKFLSELRRKGSLRDVECCLRSRRGTVHTLLQSADVIEINREQHMLVVGLDITERKQAEAELRESEARLRESEERFSKAFRANPVQLSIMRSSDKKFIEVNEAFVQWLGLDRNRILGRDSVELGMWVNLEDRAKFWADLERSDGSLRDIEVQTRTKRGTVHTLLASAESIEINREPHVFIFALDITERKRAELELLRALAREKELGQLRSNFVSMVSHEFRTPLGIIQSSAEILRDYLGQLKPAERSDHLQSICNNTRRMAGLMEEALLLGSLDAGKLEFKPAPLEFPTFVRRLAEEVMSATSERCPIELSFAEMPGDIQADQRLLQHIFTNLLTNAVKYSDPGRPVQFEIGCAEGEIVCAVRDRGIGIPEADREWLFNPFHRGRNVADRPGTGLGLVIVKRCVDLHGGKIKVESKSGAGTAVTVRLPILESKSTEWYGS